MNAVSNTVAAGATALALVTIVAIFPLLRTAASRPHPPAIAAEAVGAAQLRSSKSETAKPAPRATADDGANLHSRVERLLVPGTPRGRYQAFTMLAQCAHAIDFDRYLKSLPADAESARLRDRYGDGSTRVAAACGDLSARQLDQRVELAASAADEGIPGAASAWVEEGPYGDKTALTQRPEDPLIVEWAQQAIARVNAATKRADTEAISQFGMLCLNWELDDVARVRLLVDAALERERGDQMKSVLDRAPPG